MHNKIKAIRIHLGLTYTQVSSLINISSYKYKRYENGTIELSSDILILLSLMYGVSLDHLIFSKFTVNEILSSPSINCLKKLDLSKRLNSIENNIIAYCSFDCSNINYRVIRNILLEYTNSFCENLYDLRTCRAVEINAIASYLNISKEDYLLYEQSSTLPKPLIIADIASFFRISIDQFFNK
ncbi:MAG: helix-turn-helix transcriptional regulator [Clostridia bacterium]|nr:helix-turn-helix transcriptional regulator [Clostridia bacterium]MBQ6467370.1 helix-turn-helix transcriptional regulator [Clostridia bacterium]